MDAPDRLRAFLRAHPEGPGRVLLTGWFSFTDGEATAGDLLARAAVAQALDAAGIPHDTAWSAGFAPDARTLDEAPPEAYRHVLFVCGPLHGPQLLELHRRYAGCVRVAVNVSVIDPRGPETTGFALVLARDGGTGPPRPDLAALAPAGPLPPLVAIVLTEGQGEYGDRRGHADATVALTSWAAGKDCARLPVDTRLARDDWRLCAGPEQFLALAARCDLVVTTRLHGLVLALRAGVPALAVDPVLGGAKLSAQARALRWPALVPVEETRPDVLDRWWRWCLDGRGRAAARRRAALLARARRRRVAGDPVSSPGRGGPAAVWPDGTH
ncbi:polysaccharide pyruvyl transferase family protein [Streptomyces evansiae]|uniref:polysaccharide pyruvyl transferase family protein n=1 Tax=Streptomyces evansiae TaxID=3075535 RepID=UPI002884B6C8|nr:polysaccharide pyruvyl transferase family protein [Streptomyces sp. DSM 41859]MDT0424264.1 polysaccharide pyruvyl transferase family protein [Streptomyces sp. DSM 41859]